MSQREYYYPTAEELVFGRRRCQTHHHRVTITQPKLPDTEADTEPQPCPCGHTTEEPQTTAHAEVFTFLGRSISMTDMEVAKLVVQLLILFMSFLLLIKSMRQ